jgi:peptidoglycan/LPS O-acetylase OafA/YrhL
MALLGFVLVAVPIVLVACALPYLLIERPFMVWRPGVNRLLDALRRTTE